MAHGQDVIGLLAIMRRSTAAQRDPIPSIAGMERKIVLVSGAPGAGKTTLAIQLASILRMPLLSKDAIKECLFDALSSPPGDREWSRTLGATAMELMWRLAEDAPAVILEANFRPHSSR